MVQFSALEPVERHKRLPRVDHAATRAEKLGAAIFVGLESMVEVIAV
ncbi:hypothetical protein [Saccharothrix lopnurensis]|uniref:Uncharacterized protein n=1 Tax=Saccharothrix lopnurensis TaxID=1670621 RepID=A0ABW1PFG6_9PSEU